MTRGTVRQIALAVAAIVVLVLVGRLLGGRIPAWTEWVEEQGAFGVIAFAGLYVLATVTFVPGALLTLAAGAIFGVWRGVAIVFPSAVVGSTIAFLVARHLARPLIESRIRREGRFESIQRAVEREGLPIVFLLRLSPLIPYNLLNYALGLSRVRLRDYVTASVGMLPGTLLYVYSGRVIGDVVAISGGAAVDRGAGHYLLLAGGLVATGIVTVKLAAIARGALERSVADDGIAQT